MATTNKVLGQANPNATTLTTLYTVPGGVSAVGSTLSACNLGIGTTIRVAVRPAGAALENKHYIVYDAALNNCETMFLTLGLALAATDVVSVYAGTANVSFSLFGLEMS